MSPQVFQQQLQSIEQDHVGTDDFANQWGLAAIRAERAYAHLELQHGVGAEPGSGQTVGLIDTGIDTGHDAFAGKTVTEHFFPGATDETGDEFSHGTAVASVIAGRPSPAFTAEVNAARGVARGADIAMFAIRAGSGGDEYVPVSLAGADDADDRWAAWFAHVLNWSSGGRSLDFVNLSVGYKGIVEQYGEQELRDALDGTIAALAQAGDGAKTVFVWAAGNGHGKDCDAANFTGNPDLCVDGRVNARSVEILPGLPARIAELRGHLVAVVAVAPDADGDGGYEIASFSNRCGIAADWCVAAPGRAVRAAYFGPDPGDGSPGARGASSPSGTSLAAPMVTGGLLVLKHHFRGQLSNTALLSRLFATANKSGIYGDRGIYGQGLIDLGAATAPVGEPAIALGERVDGPGSALTGTRLAPGGAMGDGLSRAFAGHEIAAFDTLGAPFWFPLGDLAGDASQQSALARLRGLMAPREDGGAGPLRPRLAPLAAGDRLKLGVLRAPSGAEGGHLALAGSALALGTAAEGGLGLLAFSSEGVRGRHPASGAALSWRPGNGRLAFAGGWVGERETVLGGSAAGAFGRLSGASAFAGVEGKARIGAWQVGAGAEIGTVRAATRGGMIARVSPLTTSAFAVEAETALANGDGLRISLSQPLRVEAGRASIAVPVGRTHDGTVLHRHVTAGLAPSGRQIDVAARWRRTLADGAELGIGAGWTRRPGHDKAAAPELSILAGWRYAF
ncbi:MAG: S8 family serine peptidase [Defluviicoccus sp.]|nr:S8 family serine peptidase [Defluviicoccus sp.]MDE0385707.1 S8 family serine peptidase [Defluviicoccus sp.]